MDSQLQSFKKPEKGRFLLSDAYLGDPNFERTVILLTEHSRDGSLGFVLNRPLDIPLKKMLPDFPPFDARIFNGGPVEKDHLYFLHNKGGLIPNSQYVRKGIYWGGDYDALRELVINELIEPDDIHFYLGYSGWNWGQLHQEIEEHSWSIVAPEKMNMADMRNEQLWTNMMRSISSEMAYWHNAPEDPQMN